VMTAVASPARSSISAGAGVGEEGVVGAGVCPSTGPPAPTRRRMISP